MKGTACISYYCLIKHKKLNGKLTKCLLCHKVTKNSSCREENLGIQINLRPCSPHWKMERQWETTQPDRTI
uniref:Uncharacterized protein n=1 Tax=Arion vulgaris TaxID=1028688 RepID=A0A0B7AV98_9EUPU